MKICFKHIWIDGKKTDEQAIRQIIREEIKSYLVKLLNDAIDEG